MGYLENIKILNSATNPFLPNILVYVDDIFCLFRGTSDQLQSLCSFSNSASEHAKSTMNLNLQRISFVDTWILSRDNI